MRIFRLGYGDLLYSPGSDEDVFDAYVEVLEDRDHHVLRDVSKRQLSDGNTCVPVDLSIRSFRSTHGVPPHPGLSTAINLTPYLLASGSTP